MGGVHWWKRKHIQVEKSQKFITLVSEQFSIMIMSILLNHHI